MIRLFLASFFFLSLSLLLISIQVKTSTAQTVLPTPNLPLGDINVLVLTDVHSWVGGHGHLEPHLDADYGDVVSFYEHLQHYCQATAKTLFFVVNGDWIDGTGLALNGESFSLEQILEKMPWDALNVGNHELYRPETIQAITEPGGYADWWGKRYLSSNIVVTQTREPLGHLYHVLRSEDHSVLTFGFLYNMKDNVNVTTVLRVQTVVEEPWFKQALHSEPFDGILVLAHMGVADPLVQTILDKIRHELGNGMPVQFITGHTHHRDYAVFDTYSTSFEAGRYLDTLGFVSFPDLETASQSDPHSNTTTQDLFKYVYVDANKQTFQETLRVDTLSTSNGAELSQMIDRIQEEMGLDEQVGCVGETYYLEHGLEQPDSLWGYFADRVVSTQFTKQQVLLLGKGGWRYDLLAGEQRLDDVIAVSPFNETLYEWKQIDGDIILQLNSTLNLINDPYMETLPNYILISTDHVDPDKTYDLVTDKFEVQNIQKTIMNFTSNITDPVAMREITTTTIWIDHIREHSPCKGGSKHNKPKHPDRNGPHHVSIGSSSSSEEEDPARDAARLFFALLACVCVFFLGAINVYQRGKTFRRTVSARERATLDALREYNGDGLYRDDASGNAYSPHGDYSDEVDEEEDDFI